MVEKSLIKMKKGLGCRCLQNNNKGWRFWWSYANCSSLDEKVWSKGCVTGWWLQNEHYFWKFEKETWIEKTSINSICGANGWLIEGVAN